MTFIWRREASVQKVKETLRGVWDKMVSAMKGSGLLQMWILFLLGAVSGVGRAQVSTARVLRGNTRRDGEMYLCCLLFSCISLKKVNSPETDAQHTVRSVSGCIADFSLFFLRV